jgi:hypothetical protein
VSAYGKEVRNTMRLEYTDKLESRYAGPGAAFVVRTIMRSASQRTSVSTKVRQHR